MCPWLPRLLFFALLLLFPVACAGGGAAGMADSGNDSATTAPVAPAVILTRLPHDSDLFTQGLLVDPAGTILEGTGLRGQSRLRRWQLQTGQILAERKLDPEHFGEGIARHGDRIYQLTWQAGVLYLWNAADLAPLGRLSYDGEGWGLTSDGERLIRSDGSNRLHFHHPDDFRLLGSLAVHDGGKPVRWLNELEMVDGEIWANVWFSERIARIDPATGTVRGWLDLSGLATEAERGVKPQNVLNGIAWDANTRRLFVTGKHWTVLFELQPPAPGR